MTRTDAFARDMCKVLHHECPDYDWTCGGRLGESHEAVDVVGKPKGSRGKDVYIEVELRRGSPVVNVAKVWRGLRGDRVRKKRSLSRPSLAFIRAKMLAVQTPLSSERK